MSDLPKELQDAMERLLDADADSDRNPVPRSKVERIDALRTARAVIAEWRSGAVELDDAVRRLDALVSAARED